MPSPFLSFSLSYRIKFTERNFPRWNDADVTVFLCNMQFVRIIRRGEVDLRFFPQKRGKKKRKDVRFDVQYRKNKKNSQTFQRELISIPLDGTISVRRQIAEGNIGRSRHRVATVLVHYGQTSIPKGWIDMIRSTPMQQETAIDVFRQNSLRRIPL